MKISIITVCYNSQTTIKHTINSVLSQSFKNIEYIIIDGGSTDRTVSIIEEYREHLTHFISGRDEGIYDALNKGINLASGDVIGILNSDDFYTNINVLSYINEQFNLNPLVDIILGNVDYVLPIDLSRTIRHYSSNDFEPWKMYFGFMPAHPSTFLRKKVYDRVGLYKINYSIAADFDIFVRMFLVHKLSCKKINLTIVKMRTGGVSTSGFSSYWTTTHEILRSLKENGLHSNLIFVLIRLPVKYFQLMKEKIK